MIYKNEFFETSKIKKSKQLENNFKLINISINDMNKFEKTELTKKREHLQKTLGMIGTIGQLTIFLSL